MPEKKPKPKYKKTMIELKSETIAVYAHPRVSAALAELVADMNVYKGVRLTQVLEAVYEQGRKDGARAVFERVDEVRADIPHRLPGRPRKDK